MSAFTIPLDATPFEVMAALDRYQYEQGVDHSLRKQNMLGVFLSAIRGPDNGSEDDKWATTAVIRGALIPKLASDVGMLTRESTRSGLLGAWVYAMHNGGGKKRHTGYYNHFFSHARRALEMILLPDDQRYLPNVSRFTEDGIRDQLSDEASRTLGLHLEED